MVILAGGKFRENVGKTFHKDIWVLFSCGGNFREEDKNSKIFSMRKFPRLQYSVGNI